MDLSSVSHLVLWQSNFGGPLEIPNQGIVHIKKKTKIEQNRDTFLLNHIIM